MPNRHSKENGSTTAFAARWANFSAPLKKIASPRIPRAKISAVLRFVLPPLNQPTREPRKSPAKSSDCQREMESRPPKVKGMSFLPVVAKFENRENMTEKQIQRCWWLISGVG